MKKSLTKAAPQALYYVADGNRVEGASPLISGNVSGLTGNVSDLRGHVTGLRGDVTGLSGDVDDCELTDDERQRGVNVADLVIVQSAVEAA